MSWMMEQSGKQCQCERRKGKLRRQMHRETEKDTHGGRKRRARMYLSSGRLQNIWPLIGYSSLNSDAFVMSCLTH